MKIKVILLLVLGSLAFLTTIPLAAENLDNGVYISVLSSASKSALPNFYFPGSLLGQIDFAHKLSVQQELRFGLNFYSDSNPTYGSGRFALGGSFEDVFYLTQHTVRPFCGLGVSFNSNVFYSPVATNWTYTLYVPFGLSIPVQDFLTLGVYDTFGMAQMLSSASAPGDLIFSFGSPQGFVALWF